MSAYYNEFDPKAAAWLRELIKAGRIAPGEVDGVSRGVGYSGDPDNTQEARVMRLKGYGNAIVPQVAAEFIKTYMDIII